MTNASENPYQPRPVDPRRQHRIDLANARIQKLTRQQVLRLHARGFPPQKIANSVGIPVESVIEHISE